MQVLPVVAATGFVAVLVTAGAAPAIAAPREAIRASATAGHRAIRDGAPDVARSGWLAGTLTASTGREQARDGVAGLAGWEGTPGACDGALALLVLAAPGCAGPARAIDAPAQPGAVLLPCPDQVRADAAARPRTCRDQASAQWPHPAAAWPTCGCEHPPLLGPAPFTPVLPTALPPVPPTPPVAQAQPSCGCEHLPSSGSVPVAPASSLTPPVAQAQPSSGSVPVSSAAQAPAPAQTVPGRTAPSCGCQHPSSPGAAPGAQLPAAVSTQVTSAPGGRPSGTPAPRLTGSASATTSPRPAAPARVSGLSPGILPVTGFDLEGVAEVAAALLVAGGGSLLASRLGRRRPSRHGRPGRSS